MSRSTSAVDRTAQVEQLRALMDRTRPVSLAEQRVLPVLSALEPLFGGRASGVTPGLQRGSIVGVGGATGATTLALALAAGPTKSGSWAAFVGLPELGWAAAAEVGVDMDRVVVVRPNDLDRATVIAALVDAFDVVVCGLDSSLSLTDARRLAARARERGSVLLVVGGRTGGVGRARRAWPTPPDAALDVVEWTWSGLDQGAGHLSERRVVVEVTGRRAFDRPRRVELMLPGGSGAPAPVDEPGHTGSGGATVTPLRRVG